MPMSYFPDFPIHLKSYDTNNFITSQCGYEESVFAVEFLNIL